MSEEGPVFDRTIATPEGNFVARYSELGLCGLRFPKPNGNTHRETLEGMPESIRTWHETTQNALLSALDGKEPSLLPPLDLSSGTTFQKSVWAAMRRIPLGQTSSYGEIAAVIGQPKAVRAVGRACGANPIPVLVPCHRVLAANQALGGFSGGLD